jgi:hypothetical protein
VINDNNQSALESAKYILPSGLKKLIISDFSYHSYSFKLLVENIKKLECVVVGHKSPKIYEDCLPKTVTDLTWNNDDDIPNENLLHEGITHFRLTSWFCSLPWFAVDIQSMPIRLPSTLIFLNIGERLHFCTDDFKSLENLKVLEVYNINELAKYLEFIPKSVEKIIIDYPIYFNPLVESIETIDHEFTQNVIKQLPQTIKQYVYYKNLQYVYYKKFFR